MRLISSAVRLLVVISLFLLGGISAVLARSWSYNYHPEILEPTPTTLPTKAAPSGQSSTPKLLKRAIVSDLAIFAQNQSLQRNTGYSDHMKYETSRLSLFDSMNSSEALSAFASLSGYYLGASGEKLYRCLALRKGRALEPYLEPYLRGGNPECVNELGQDFTKPSESLDGYTLCSTSQQVEKRLTELIAEIEARKSCTDSDLAQLTGGVRK